MEAETLGDTLRHLPALVDTLDDSLAKVEAETLGDTLSDAQAMVDTLGNLRMHWSKRCLAGNLRCRQRGYVKS